MTICRTQEKSNSDSEVTTERREETGRCFASRVRRMFCWIGDGHSRSRGKEKSSMTHIFVS